MVVRRYKTSLEDCILTVSVGKSVFAHANPTHAVHHRLSRGFSMNVVIACGGTGGHLFPGLAVAEQLRARGHQSMLLISEKEIDALAVRDYANLFRFETLPSIGLPRLLSPAIVGFTRGFAASLSRCRQFYRDFKPDAVLGMGGFTSTAPMLMGRRFRSPTFIHESNAIPGKANRLNARLARVVLLGFRECAKYFPAQTCCVTTGTPIRTSLRNHLLPADARKLFGFDPASPLKTLLVMGGSQGAHGLNQAVVAAASVLKDFFQIIHFTGKADEAAVRTAYAQRGVSAYVAAFHHQMQEAYSAADLAIARSGAASLSELACFRLPSVLIPFPAAAEDHQTLNAQIFAQAGAALVVTEREISGDSLARTVSGIFNDPSKLAAMAVAAQQLAPADAASLVVETLETQCRP